MPSSSRHTRKGPCDPASLDPDKRTSAHQTGEPAKWSLWRGLFGGQRSQARYFSHFEQVFEDDHHKVCLAKAMWLTRRGQHFASWGNTLRARAYLAEAIAIKRDYFPAYVSLGAAYRQTAQNTGLLSLLEAAKEVFESVPKCLRLLDTEVGLDQCGAAVHAEWANIYVIMGEWEEAENHLLLALQCHQRAQALGRELRDFLTAIGCFVSPGFEAHIRRVLADLRKQIA